MATPTATRELNERDVITTLCEAFPSVQAIYLFGSFADGTQQASSDVDIALLLPADVSHSLGKNLLLHPAHGRLARLASREVDLLNLRCMPTVLQHEIVMKGKRIYCSSEPLADEFEIATMSRYQKLNEEPAEILAEFRATGRAFDV